MNQNSELVISAIVSRNATTIAQFLSNMVPFNVPFTAEMKVDLYIDKQGIVKHVQSRLIKEKRKSGLFSDYSFHAKAVLSPANQPPTSPPTTTTAQGESSLRSISISKIKKLRKKELGELVKFSLVDGIQKYDAMKAASVFMSDYDKVFRHNIPPFALPSVPYYSSSFLSKRSNSNVGQNFRDIGNGVHKEVHCVSSLDFASMDEDVEDFAHLIHVESFDDRKCAFGVSSSYGWDFSKGFRTGAPIADVVFIGRCGSSRVPDNNASISHIFGVADGTGHGEDSRRAASLAVEGAKEVLKKTLQSQNLRTIDDVVNLLGATLLAAHERIVNDKHYADLPIHVEPRGATTLCIGVVCKIEKPPASVCIIGSVGDCRAFRWSKEDGTVTEITSSVGGSKRDITNAGGQLGWMWGGKDDAWPLMDPSEYDPEDAAQLAQLKDARRNKANPRLDNVHFAMIQVRPQDRILCASDGVTDNLTDGNIAAIMVGLPSCVDVSRDILQAVLDHTKEWRSAQEDMSKALVKMKTIEKERAGNISGDVEYQTTRKHYNHLMNNLGSLPGKPDHISLVLFEVN